MTSRPANVHRNDPCPCGSGKKYKRCCRPRDEETARAAAADPDEVETLGIDEALSLALSEPLEIAQSWYDVAEEDGARALVADLPGARIDEAAGLGSDGWILGDLMGEGEEAPGAWLRFDEHELRVVAPNGRLLAVVRDLLEEFDPDGAVAHVRSTIADLGVTIAMMRAGRGPDAEADAEGADGAAQELLTTTLRSYYERWVRLPCPLFGNRSPLQVARGKDGVRRELLLGILALLERTDLNQPAGEGVAYDFSEVWRMLGLDRAAELPPE